MGMMSLFKHDGHYVSEIGHLRAEIVRQYLRLSHF